MKVEIASTVWECEEKLTLFRASTQGLKSYSKHCRKMYFIDLFDDVWVEYGNYI